MRRIPCLIVAVGLLACARVAFADDPVPIGEVVADPDAHHFRILPLQGTVRQVTPLPPYSPSQDTTCYGAYAFTLEDETGSIEVSVLGICGKPLLRKPEVLDGEAILLTAQILSPNRLTSSKKGEEKKLRALANSITHLSPVVAPPEDSVPGQIDETAKPEGSDKAEKDSGY